MSETNQIDWASLYTAAQEFQKGAPWAWMTDNDLFAVENPRNGELGYCSIMGNGEMEYGLSVFRGEMGLWLFNRLVAGKEEAEEILLTPKIGLLLVSRADLDKKDLEIIRALKLTFRGQNAWPLFRSGGNGYWPWYLNKGETEYMTAAIHQSLRVAGAVVGGKLPSLEYGSSENIYVRRLVGEEWQGEWQKRRVPKQKPGANPEPLNAAEEDQLARQRNPTRKLSGCWQFDIFILPAPIMPESGRPFYPICFMAVDGAKGVIINFEIQQPWITAAEKRNVFLKMLGKAGVFPQELQVKSREVKDLIEPVAAALGIILRVHSLGFMDRAKMELNNYLGSGRL